MCLTVRGVPAIAMSLALTLLLSAGASGAAPIKLWYKVCTKEPLPASSANVEAGDICQTFVDVRDNKTAILIGRVSIRQRPGQTGYQLETLLPLNSALAPGALVKIDEREPVKLAYKRCDAGGCYAYAAVGDPVITQMKSGKQITFLAVNKAGKAWKVPLPLAGFAEAFDGPPLPIDKYQIDQKKIAEVIAKRLVEAGQTPPKVTPATSQALANMGTNPVVNSGWYKICTEVPVPPQQIKTGVCLTQADIRDEDSMVLAGKIAARKVDGNASWQMLVMLPLNMSLPEGATAVIDKGEPLKLAFTTCDTAGCYAEVNIPAGTLDRLKSGHEVSYTGTEESGNTLLVPVSLSGFKEAFDGAPMPMEVYNAEMRRITETILVRAARRRKEERPDASR
jgi:invasion protein IalB